MDLMVGDHVILGTPTGSGKSLVALGMQFMARIWLSLPWPQEGRRRAIC